MSLYSELKRRNVLRVGAAYIVTAWLIVQVVETLFPIYGLSETAMRWVVNVLAIGLVPVLVLAWVFEWTPEGLKRDAEVAHDAPTSSASARRLDRVILAVLALALGYFAFDKFVLDPARDTALAESARQEGRSEAITESYGEQSIAVLPFDDMSPEKDQEYLSDGIAEEVLNLLAQIPDLRVISRTSAFAFKDKDVSIPEIARQLNVAHILEGSVRKAGDRIRVTAQLIEARSDTHLWSQTWDRTLDDVFAIQDELAADMAEQLQLRLAGDTPQSRRVDPDAYLLYLEGHHYAAYRDPQRAVSLLEQALAIEPDFPDALADLGRAYFMMSETSSLRDHTGDVNFLKSTAAIERLTELAPDHPSALAYNAFDLMEDFADYAGAARAFERALARYPRHWDIVRTATMFARVIRQGDVGASLTLAAVRRDPLCNDCSALLAQCLSSMGRYDETETEILRIKQLQPGPVGGVLLARTRLLAGKPERVAAALTFDGLIEPDTVYQYEAMQQYLAVLTAVYTGTATDASAQVKAILERTPTELYLSPVQRAELWALAGAHKEAFTVLDSMGESYQPWRLSVELDTPFLESLHDDPRWKDLLEYARVTPDQLAAIRFDPPLPD